MIYFDNAATTRTADEVIKAMLPCFDKIYGNASAAYSFASDSRRVLNSARDAAAGLIGAQTNEIFFTSGGTESDNMAIRCSADYYMLNHGGSMGHIITSAIEHHAVLRTLAEFERHGGKVTYLDVDSEGLVDPEDVKKALRNDTFLITVMTANNEVGTIEPVSEIGRIAHEHHCLFHTDAVQAFGQIPVSVHDMNIDMLSASAHKLYGPKGTGLIYIKSGIRLAPWMTGGMQERGRRAGTENIPGIAGFSEAIRLAGLDMESNAMNERKIRDRIADRLLNGIPGCRLNGPAPDGARLPGNLNISFDGINAETLVIKLDLAGICVSGGSACSTGSQDPSHVLTAMGLGDSEARSALRISVGRYNTADEADRAVTIIKECVEDLCRRKK